jgi:hypothetical protein
MRTATSSSLSVFGYVTVGELRGGTATCRPHPQMTNGELEPDTSGSLSLVGTGSQARRSIREYVE